MIQLEEPVHIFRWS